MFKNDAIPPTERPTPIPPSATLAAFWIPSKVDLKLPRSLVSSDSIFARRASMTTVCLISLSAIYIPAPIVLGNDGAEIEFDGRLLVLGSRLFLWLCEPRKNIACFEKGGFDRIAVDVIDRRRDRPGTEKIPADSVLMAPLKRMQFYGRKLPKSFVCQAELDYCKAPEIEPGRPAKGGGGSSPSLPSSLVSSFAGSLVVIFR